MSRNHLTGRAVRLVLATAAAASAYVPLATAQDQLGEVLVTGSRIVRQDYEATSPVFTIDAKSLAAAGTPQIEQVLNELPQLVPTITTTSNNPSLGGQANVDLRGLGTSRTLVLLDGGRLQPSTTGGLIDLNTVPAGLIESIEIMTGGGSATYGSEAIAGVVNIKLRRDFEGIELRAHGAETGESDGTTRGFSALFGGNFENGGNAVMFVSYDKRDEVFAGARDFSRVALGPQLQPLGSTSTPEGYYVVSSTNAPTQAAADSVWGQYGSAPGAVLNTSWVGFNEDSSVFSRNGTVNFQGDTSDPGFNAADYTYNYSPVNYLQLPLERRQVAAFGHVNVGESAEFYGRMMYTNYQASQELAATPISSGIGSTIPVTNPFIPADLATLLASRVVDPAAPFTFNKRTADVGPRNGTNDYDVVQGMLGMRGDFKIGDRDWNWDVSSQWGHTQRTEVQTGNVSRSRLQAVYDNPDALAANGCTGFNPFGVGNISPECAAAISVRASNITEIEAMGATAVVTGGVFDLPAGALQVAFGLEYGEMEADFKPDQFLASGDVVGFNAALPVTGKTDASEAFAEVSVPILAEMTGIHYLGFDAGYRYTDHNIVGNFDTYMAGLEYKPIESVKIRGSYQHATRAPSIFELFRPQTEGFPAYRDPCWDNSPERLGADAAQVNALCATQGAGPAFPQGNSQVRALSGGNPDLDPEFADTITLGVSWQPDFGDNTVRMAVDWFSYELDDVIGAVGASTIVTRCFNAQGANPTYDNSNLWCQLFSRNQAGIAEDVLQTDQNLGKRNVEGVDFQIDYRRPFGPGEFRASMALTHLLNWERQEDPASPLVAVDGTITIEVAETFPELKGVLNLGYSWNDFDFGWAMRYIDGMDVVNNDAARTLSADSCGAILPPTCVPPVATTVSSYDYHRLTMGWQATEGLGVMLGVDNLFDKEPPIYTTNSRAGVQANTDPSTYDVLGRRYFLSATYKF